MQVFTEEDDLEVAKLVDVLCQWKLSWLKLDSKCKYQDREYRYVFPLSWFFSKIDMPGFAKCNLCNGKEINYNKNGSYVFLAHVKTKNMLNWYRMWCLYTVLLK